MINIAWADFRKLVDGTTSKLAFREVASDSLYNLFAADGSLSFRCELYKNPASITGVDVDQANADCADYEASIQCCANKTILPRTSDGRPITLAARFRGDIDPWFAGSMDSSGPGEGALFELGWDSVPGSPETKTLDVTFEDWVYIANGSIKYRNAGRGDYARVLVNIPATATTAADPANTGNCNLVASGYGYNIIVPAAGDGEYDVADAAKKPVPAVDSAGTGVGYWNWSEPDTGLGTVSASTPGAGYYHLADVAIPAVQWTRKFPLLGDGVVSLDPQVKARKLLPYWVVRVELHNEALGLLEMIWWWNMARKKTI